MDKYEYKLKLEQLKGLAAAEDYRSAAKIAETINWQKVRNTNTLCLAADIFSRAERYEECREILLMARENTPTGRSIARRLTANAIKMKDLAGAKEYYDQFCALAPHDSAVYELGYQIACLSSAPLDEKISILKKYNEAEFSELWAYELAALYAQAGMRDECVQTCDDIILWFGDGRYVEKALDLKRHFQPLTPAQEEKLGELGKGDGAVPLDAAAGADDPAAKLSASKFNTQNLQEELARNIQQIMGATKQETVDETLEGIKKIVTDIPYLDGADGKAQSAESSREINEKVDEKIKQDFEKLLSEENDGQISIPLPEDKKDEDAVEGQMSIEDVLAEWEKTKRAAQAAIEAAEAEKLELSKENALKEAEDIMERLKKIIPILTAVPGEDLPSDDGSVSSILTPDEQEPKDGEEAQTDSKTTAAAAASGAASQKDDETARGDAEESKEAKAPESVKTDTHKDTAMESAPDEVVREDGAAPENEGAAREDLSGDILSEDSLPDIESLLENALKQEEGIKADTKEEDANKEPAPDAEAAKEDAAGEAGQASKEAFEKEKEEDIPAPAAASGTKEQPDETCDYEAGLEKMLAEVAVDKETEDTKESGGDISDELPEIEAPEDVLLEEEPEGPRELTDEQKELFSYFLPVPGMEEQIKQTLLGARKRIANSITSLSGNIVIQGEPGSGKTVLATSLVKAIQKEIGDEDSKIGKISAASLNKRDFAQLLPKIAGGYLIVENAGELSEKTAARMSQVMENNTQGLVVILEDTRQGIEKALSLNFGFAGKFTEKINIPIFTIDELVDFGRSYAAEMECVIDEMGILALYNRINNIKKIERATTLAEVKDIVDEAIAHAEGGGIKKFFAKRYDEEDCLILRESDFNA